MIRVLHVVGTMDLGGAETFIMNVYRNIDRTKIQFDFLCHNRIEAKYTEEILSMGGLMYCIPGISHVGPIRYQNNLYKFFASHPEYKVVHSHQNELSGMILKQAKKAGVPNRFAHSHIAFVTMSIMQKTEWKFFQLYFKGNVTKAFACSDMAREALYKGELLNQCEVIHNAIDTEKMRYNDSYRMKVRNELSISDGIIIGHIGRFAHQKNHKFVLEIFENVLRKKQDSHLVLIGEGYLKYDMFNYAKELGISDNVHFLGSRRDISDCLCAMDLFLFPSLYEGLGIVAIEAQAAGLPVLASTTVPDEAMITDLIRREPLSKSAEEWADIALEMYSMAKYIDRQIYSDKVRTAGYDIKVIVDRLEELYLK